MTEAKVPDSKNDWKAIDIFLFSNGQQSSPPRKYHLDTNQLDWWKATLNHLAKAHYGSLHSMVDLYMIDGQKVETPMQLSNGTAYVAVVPPDAFISASYEKYLIKASRSWEKGQSRRLSNTTVDTPVSPGEIEIPNDKSNATIKSHEANAIDGSVTLKTIVASTMDNQASVIVTPSVDNLLNNLDTNTNAVKHVDNNKNSTIQRPAKVKKIYSLPSPPTTRKPSIKRRDSVKIVTDLPNDKTTVSANNSKLLSKSKLLKPSQKKRDSLPDKCLPKVEEVMYVVKSPSSSLKVIGHNILQAKNVEYNVPDNNDVLATDWYKNIDRERGSLAVNLDAPLIKYIDRQGAETQLLNENHQTMEFINCKIEDEMPIEDTTISRHTSGMNINESHFAQTPSLFPITVNKPEENVAVINKEGTVNLKLNIEVWNGPANIITHSKTLPKKDLVNIIRPEKDPEVDIEDKLKEHGNTSHIISNEIGECNQGNCKVIIVKCSCLDHGGDKNTNNTFHVNRDNSCVVVLPKWKLEESCKRCYCKNETTNETLPKQIISVNYPVTRAVSLISLLQHKISRSEVMSRNNSTQFNVETNTVHDNNEVTMVKRKSVAICEDQVIQPNIQHPSMLESGPQNPEIQDLEKPEIHNSVNPNFIVFKNESILHKIANRSTQTESCDLLLEARLQDDGHYSFHIPPLQMLKQYKY